MSDKLPENIDQIEDFYKFSFNDEAETPSTELWGKIESHIITSSTQNTNYFWKNGILRLSIEVLVLMSILYYLQNPQIISENKEVTPPVSKEIRPSNPQLEDLDRNMEQEEVHTVKANQPDSKIRNEKVKSNPDFNPVVKEEIVAEPEKKNITEPIPVAEPLPSPEPKIEIPVKEEPQDLYSKLKKKHVVDSSKSLFIEKKK